MVDAWFARFGRQSLNKLGAAMLISLTSLGVVLSSIAIGLGVIVRGQDGVQLLSYSLISMLITWWLASTPVRNWQAGLFLTLIGGMLILMGIDGLSYKLFALIDMMIQFVISALRWKIGQPIPNFDLAQQLGIEYFDVVIGILQQTALWIYHTALRQPIFNPVATTLTWNFTIWSISAWAAWGSRRLLNPLLGVLPGITIFAGALSFTRTDAVFLVPVLGGALLLIGWGNYVSRESSWQKQATDYAEDLRFDAAMWSLAFIFIIATIAMLASWLSPQKTFKFARGLLQPRSPDIEEIGEAIGLDQPATQSQAGELLNPGVLPCQHMLGSGAELSEDIVMLIRVAKISEINTECINSDCAPSSGRYYWRSLTFDLYTGRGWMTSPIQTSQYMRGERVAPLQGSDQTVIVQQIQDLRDFDNQIYSFGDPTSIDQDFVVSLRTAPKNEKDLFSTQLQNEPNRGTYQVTSIHPLIDSSKLQKDGDIYPDWILERYLQLPETIPQRILELARSLTIDHPSAYAKAVAIESYLRSIPYSLEVPLPPANRDVVDYYIFDLRSGYCDYAASAMVVLARAAGLPARLAIGFAGGRYEEQNDFHIVTEADSHSWVEVYFPGAGWIEFEPTSGQPALSHLSDTQPAQDLELLRPAIPFHNPWPILYLTGGIAFSGILLLLAAYLLIWPVFDAIRLSRMKPNVALITLYSRLRRAAAYHDLHVSKSETPHEFAVRFGNHMSKSSGAGLKSIFNPAGQEIHSLVALYTRAIYSPHGLAESNRIAAVRLWIILDRRLRLALVTKYIERK